MYHDQATGDINPIRYYSFNFNGEIGGVLMDRSNFFVYVAAAF